MKKKTHQETGVAEAMPAPEERRCEHDQSKTKVVVVYSVPEAKELQSLPPDMKARA